MDRRREARAHWRGVLLQRARRKVRGASHAVAAAAKTAAAATTPAEPPSAEAAASQADRRWRARRGDETAARCNHRADTAVVGGLAEW